MKDIKRRKMVSIQIKGGTFGRNFGAFDCACFKERNFLQAEENGELWRISFREWCLQCFYCENKLYAKGSNDNLEWQN